MDLAGLVPSLLPLPPILVPARLLIILFLCSGSFVTFILEYVFAATESCLLFWPCWICSNRFASATSTSTVTVTPLHSLHSSSATRGFQTHRLLLGLEPVITDPLRPESQTIFTDPCISHSSFFLNGLVFACGLLAVLSLML
ncbi:hypothetical protein BO78DRAFT_161748 [Aspergillus sclerotiicarbonarius CBS 121057]|uniref:Uncharacterized protein n=1 Tax=Aspergillus sclerotiicarbonarius (strain CBS 121057 / IBT 28362) TaxID=1448318 RepID=A0A319FMW3_ASPSB|nr:hypothetical protein BO78DRAFT_161748 [Aspergillus sclerotiicarbonarius CBS 121057]